MQLFYVVLLTSLLHGNYVDFSAILPKEDVPCYKFFPGGFGERKDYSGFDRDQWPRRTSQQHRQDAYRVRNCKSETEKLASKLGTRYTALLELPYYEAIQMCAIDPMHNLFLGTAKRVFSKWIESDIIGKAGLENIQSRIEEISTSSDIGRLPGNIKSNYGGYTAAQWKNFVLLYSMYALKDTSRATPSLLAILCASLPPSL